MPAAVADPKRSLGSEQISPATIANHTVYEKTPNLHQSHILQWRARPYLVGLLSRLVGKPRFSPWLSNNVLPLKKAANSPNSAISLTQTFGRILFCVYNSLYFGVQKEKNGDRGTIVFTATLTLRYQYTLHCNPLRFIYENFSIPPKMNELYSGFKKSLGASKPSEHPSERG